MQNDTSQKMNWKTSLLLAGISIIVLAFISVKLAITMASMFLIIFSSAQLAKWVSTKTIKPILPAIIMGFGLAIALGWMKWFPETNHTLNGLLTEVGKMLAFLGVPALIILALLGISSYWKKHNPPAVKPPAKEEIDQLDDEFSTWYWRGTGLLFIGSIVFGFTIYVLLKAIGTWYYSNFIDGIIVEPIDPAAWGLVALFLGIYLSMLAVFLFLKLRLGDNYEKLKNYYDFKMSIDNKKAMRTTSLIYIVLIAGSIFICLTTFTRFTETEIAIHRPYWLSEHIYSYSEITSIQQITTVRPGTDNIIFVIAFSDGTSWRTSYFHTDEIPSYYPSILELASNKSGVPIKSIFEHIGDTSSTN